MKFHPLFFSAAVIFMAICSSISNADLTEGLVAYWPFNEGSGDTTADLIGGSDGEFIDGTTWETGDAKIGSGAVRFDGVDDRIFVGIFDVEGSGITLAGWIKPDGGGATDGRVISKATDHAEDAHWWMLSKMDSTKVRFRLKTNVGATTTLISNAGDLDNDVWQHVAATWDGEMMRVYRDGNEIASMAKAGGTVAVDDSVTVAIGNQPPDTTNRDKPFSGLIDDVVVYNRALSEAELKQLASGLSPMLAVKPSKKLAITWGAIRH